MVVVEVVVVDVVVVVGAVDAEPQAAKRTIQDDANKGFLKYFKTDLPFLCLCYLEMLDPVNELLTELDLQTLLGKRSTVLSSAITSRE